MPCAIHDLRSIRRPPRPAVIAGRGGELPNVAAVDIHRVDVEITALERREHDALPVRREHAFGSVHAVVGESAQVLAVAPDGVDVERIDAPDITLRGIGLRWA